jgi:hypothetical protein
VDGTPDWCNMGKPLRAAPKLKPPALPGDIYFLFRLGSALGRGIHWYSPDTDREGALIANRWGTSLCKTEHSPTNPATVGFKSGQFATSVGSRPAPKLRKSGLRPRQSRAANLEPRWRCESRRQMYRIAFWCSDPVETRKSLRTTCAARSIASRFWNSRSITRHGTRGAAN